MPMKLVELEGVSRANAYQIPPELMLPGENPRTKPDKDIRELADSILKHGQLVAVIVYTDDAGNPHILDGNRRVEAIRYINDNEDVFLTEYPDLILPLKVRCEVYKGKDAYEASVAATHKRKGFSPIDLGKIIQTLEAKGKSRKEIAKLLEISEPLISRTLKLTTLPANLQRDIHLGKMSAEAGYEMTGLTEQEQATVLQDSGVAAPETKRPKRETNMEKSETGRPEPDTSPASGETTEAKSRPKPLRQAIRRLKREKAEHGEASIGAIGLSRKEIREIFAEWAGCQDGTIEEPIMRLAQAVVKCIDGEVGSRAVLNRMRELGEGT